MFEGWCAGEFLHLLALWRVGWRSMRSKGTRVRDVLETVFIMPEAGQVERWCGQQPSCSASTLMPTGSKQEEPLFRTSVASRDYPPVRGSGGAALQIL